MKTTGRFAADIIGVGDEDDNMAKIHVILSDTAGEKFAQNSGAIAAMSAKLAKFGFTQVGKPEIHFNGGEKKESYAVLTFERIQFDDLEAAVAKFADEL